MIGRDYCVAMARYNAWQNKQLIDVVQAMPHARMMQDEGAFFGSVLGTLNHLIWGDRIWMSRFDGGDPPEGSIETSKRLYPSVSRWRDARLATDHRIVGWAESIDPATLAGALHWYSGATGQNVSRPLGVCITHMFNHQTHHRGQIHAMLTRIGGAAPVSDLVFMPEAA